MSTTRRVNLHVEGVPNPNAMKFVLENGIIVDEPYEFRDPQMAQRSPLAKRLLTLRFVDRVLLNRNYITVVKDMDNSPAWREILPEVRSLIQMHLEQNEPILYLGAEKLAQPRDDEAIASMIIDLLNRHIRPPAQEDGGDILFESYADGVVNLSMHGACHRCPYAAQTLKQGVEKVLTQLIPEVKRVTATANYVH